MKKITGTYAAVLVSSVIGFVLSGSAFGAEPVCSVAAISAVAPAGMRIGEISDLVADRPVIGADKRLLVQRAQLPGMKHGVARVQRSASEDGIPDYCLVTGSFVTNPRTGKQANFAAGLPLRGAWNRKFLFEGCGGNCGVMRWSSALPELKAGYAVWMTDDGHVGKPGPGPTTPADMDATWMVLSPGRPNTDAITDYDYRAVHTLTLLGKVFTGRFYGSARVEYSYFDGCSDGGREGMVEVSRFPKDYNGVVAGAPYFDVANEIVTTVVGIQAQLRAPGAALSPRLFHLLAQATESKCDRADGIKDGLIQHPGLCDFDPRKDLPLCHRGRSNDSCFTREQVDTVSILFSAITDRNGKVLFPGWSVANPDLHLVRWLGFPSPPSNPGDSDPWKDDPSRQPAGWYYASHTLHGMAYAGIPDFDAFRALGVKFQRGTVGGRDGLHAVMSIRTAALLEKRLAAASGATPAAATGYLAQGRKLILFHGFSDGLITPFRTIQYYRALATLSGGYTRLRQNAELFMVPGMGHCRGGPVPYDIGQIGVPARKLDAAHDVVTALSNWVEKGTRPRSLIASTYGGGEETSTERAGRTMPLCPFPEVARYKGAGNLNQAANWVCSARDGGLTEVGPDGARVGMNAPLWPQAEAAHTAQIAHQPAKTRLPLTAPSRAALDRSANQE